MGFNAGDGTLGQGGLAFGRQSFVGLSDSWGELTLGRQYGSLYRLGADFNTFGIASSGPSANVIGGFAGGYEPFRGASATAVPPAAGATGNGSPSRINNSIRYASPTWNDLQGTAIWGLGEKSGSPSNNRIIDLSIRYASAPFGAYLLYVSDKTADAAFPSNVSTAGFGGTYRLGSYKLFVGGIAVDDKSPNNQDGRGYWAGCEYYWSANTLRAEWLQNRPR